MDLTVQGKPMSHNSEASKTALELLKQIATLASAVLVLSGTFVGNMLPVPYHVLILLGLSWLLLVFALLYSIKSTSAIVQSQIEDNDDWAEGSARKWGARAKWLFFSGLVLLITFAGIGSVLKGQSKNVQDVNVRIIDQGKH